MKLVVETKQPFRSVCAHIFSSRFRFYLKLPLERERERLGWVGANVSVHQVVA